MNRSYSYIYASTQEETARLAAFSCRQQMLRGRELSIILGNAFGGKSAPLETDEEIEQNAERWYRDHLNKCPCGGDRLGVLRHGFEFACSALCKDCEEKKETERVKLMMEIRDAKAGEPARQAKARKESISARAMQESRQFFQALAMAGACGR